ncbi:MAG: hypothetical protein HY078_11340 [Elusimicrobia bacterium]|nr:hypothetical protein [Elusimicrobiota bacterium]
MSGKTLALLGGAFGAPVALVALLLVMRNAESVPIAKSEFPIAEAAAVPAQGLAPRTPPPAARTFNAARSTQDPNSSSMNLMRKTPAFAADPSGEASVTPEPRTAPPRPAPTTVAPGRVQPSRASTDPRELDLAADDSSQRRLSPMKGSNFSSFSFSGRKPSGFGDPGGSSFRDKKGGGRDRGSSGFQDSSLTKQVKSKPQSGITPAQAKLAKDMGITPEMMQRIQSDPALRKQMMDKAKRNPAFRKQFKDMQSTMEGKVDKNAFQAPVTNTAPAPNGPVSGTRPGLVDPNAIQSTPRETMRKRQDGGAPILTNDE